MSEVIGIARRKDVVVVEDLQMVYRVGKVEVPALRGVDLSVKEGEFVAVIGPSGCGKSTLLHLIGGLLQPTSGRILIEGVSISSVSDFERTEIRRQRMGFVFQSYNLLNTLTARENIALAKRIQGNGHYEDGSAHTILRMLGLENKMDHKPWELSGGEQQRVGIARAVVNKPPLLLADEPTGNLDPENKEKIMGILFDYVLKHESTLITVTHDHDMLRGFSNTVNFANFQKINR